MALDRNAKDRKTSLHGQRFGLDYENQLVGQNGVRHSHETITAPGALTNHGLSILNSSTAIATTLTAPPSLGTEKTVINYSTGTHTVVRSTADGACILYGSTGTSPLGQTITMTGAGAAVSLIAVSSDTWVVSANSAPTGLVAISTST